MVNKQRIPNLKQAVSIVSLFSVFLLFGCNLNNTIVANVGDASLTDKDVFLLMKHYGYQPSDSIKYRAIVEDWCSNEIFNQELKKKHPEEWALIKLRSNSLSADLAKHYLEENDLRAKLDTIVTDQEIKDYYDSHQEEFILNDYIVKALYLKIPKNLDFKEKNVHRNYLLKNDKDLAELNSYAKLYAENYYFNDSTWKYLNQIIKDVPIQKYNVDNIVLNRSKTYFSDEEYTYFINIIDYKLKDEAPPLNFLAVEIRNSIITHRLHLLKEQNESKLIQGIKKNNEININI